MDPAGIQGITWTDPTVAANRVAADITASGEADIVVVLAHFGPPGAPTDGTSACPTDSGDFGGLVAGATDDIDLILAGDTHIQVNCLAANGAPVLMAQQYAEAIGRVQLQVDPESNEVSVVDAQILPLFDDEGAPLYPSDPEVEAIAQAAAEDAEVLGAVPIGEITDDITRAFGEDGSEDRGAESAAGNLITDAQLAATSSEGTGGGQIAFMNAGGVRADFEFAASGAEGDGVVTYAEAATVQPFANGVVTMTLTGEQIKSVLEEQWQPDDAGRPVLWLGVSEGFEFYYEPEAARGERITGMFLHGEVIDPAAQYRVTVNSFLAGGGDNFATLTEGMELLDTGFNDLNVLVEYFEAASPIDAASLIPRSFVGQPPSDPTPSPLPSGDDDGDDGRNPGFGVDTGRTGDDGTLGAGTLGAIGGLTLLLAAGGYAVRRRTSRSGAAR